MTAYMCALSSNSPGPDHEEPSSIARKVVSPVPSYNAELLTRAPHPVTSAAATTRPASAAPADPVAAGMARVDGVIAEHLRSDVVLVNQIAQYIVGAYVNILQVGPWM